MKEENARRFALEQIKSNLEGQQLRMEENRLKREEEEAKLRALEERIRGNQANRLKTLEAELSKRDHQFDEAKRQEIMQLRKLEDEMLRRSMDFKVKMAQEEEAWEKQTREAQVQLEEKIRVEEAEKR